MARFESVAVHARAAASPLPAHTRTELSELDAMVPGTHPAPCLIFSHTQAKHEVVEQLRAGLANVLTCLPLVGGTLAHDASTKQAHLQRDNGAAVSLGVRHLDEEPDSPSFAALSAAGFPASFFAAHAADLVPPGAAVFGFREDPGCPVAVFQATFLRGGGLVLAMPFFHRAGDATSMHHVLALWAASSRAAARGLAPPLFVPSLDRTYFRSARALSREQAQGMKAAVRGLAFAPAPRPEDPPPPPPQLPPTELAIYHVSTERCAALKAACQPRAGFVSTYDGVAGLAWRGVTRARLVGLEPEAARQVRTEFAHAITVRGKRSGGAVPDEYVGNAFMTAPTQPVAAVELVAEGAEGDAENGLAAAARRVRECTDGVGPRSIPDVLDVCAALAPQERPAWDWRPFNVFGTAWTAMRPSEAYDFGFGPPAFFRLLVLPFDGMVAVLPNAADRRALDLFVVVAPEVQARLREDPEFAAYCAPVG